VILDEPMSGLDPLGRRDVRSLILRLRDRGCTVFFSSHVLADAEALCSRVAILAGGRLAVSGRLSDILAFQAHGWELIVSNLGEAALKSVQERGLVRGATKLAEGRYALDLPLTPPPEQTLALLITTGAALVSLTPMRDTLEDFFVRQVSGARPSRFVEKSA
jgi:ABC-2 type transport system ATP-binding protein